MKRLASLFILISALPVLAFAGAPDKSYRVWPSIPFIRGADLCSYRDAYSSSRNEYMNNMVRLASNLMGQGLYGEEALQMIYTFNQTYNRNRELGAKSLYYMDVTLEGSFKAYLDQLYRQTRPLEKKLVFFNPGETNEILNAATRKVEAVPPSFHQLGYIIYSTYSLAPNCRGDIMVTLHVVDRDGKEESFQATAEPQFVMGYVAEAVFKHFQRTRFPTVINNRGRALTVLGGLNGDIGIVIGSRTAERACEALGARLPTKTEYEILEAYGPWSGGIELGRTPWAMAGGNVFHPELRNPDPVRSETSINAKQFNYVCVSDGKADGKFRP